MLILKLRSKKKERKLQSRGGGINTPAFSFPGSLPRDLPNYGRTSYSLQLVCVGAIP